MKLLLVVLAILALSLPATFAVDFTAEPSDEDKATFDQMLDPVVKIYNLVKYAASAIAVMVLLFAGVNFMLSGDDPKKRDTSKAMGVYVIIGLVVIWAAPLVVNFVVA